MLKSLNADRFAKPSLDFAPGPAPVLNWIDIERLAVDDQYQRGISRRGLMNISQIAEHFDWSKFAPVIVAPVEGGLFAIVDGRTTAAMVTRCYDLYGAETCSRRSNASPKRPMAILDTCDRR